MNLSTAGALLIAGFVFSKLARMGLEKVLKRHIKPRQIKLMQRIVAYTIFFLFLAAALEQLGFDLGILLGAAGILSAALAFASQTAVSNIISGIFLIFEKPFRIGDYITVNNIRGEVFAIDLLSIKIRTLDNTLVRVPSETMIKTSVTNFSHFKTRRADILIGVGYDTNLETLTKALISVAESDPLFLAEPAPQIALQAFGDSSINLRFSAWCKRQDLSEFKNNLYAGIQTKLAKEKIDIPYPHIQIVGRSSQKRI